MIDNGYRCSKCGSDMEEGFIAEYNHGNVLVTNWYPGAPKVFKVEAFGVTIAEWMDAYDKRMLPIQTYRCTHCGFLESYARPQTDERQNLQR